MSLSRHYLDHAATTPVSAEVIRVMAEDLARFGNASSLHARGRDARRRVEESRETIAKVLRARPAEVIFTSGGTESDNLGVLGLWRQRREEDPRRRRIVVSAIEHSAVLDCVEHLEAAEGAIVTRVMPDQEGRITAQAVRAAIETGQSPLLGPATVALVAVMWVNNEIGTVQPVADIAAVAHEYGIPVLSDAVQAVGHVPVDFGASGLDVAAVSGHKVGGPPGVGVLLARTDLALAPMTFGGGQERQLRSGTLATSLIVGLGVALRETADRMPEQVDRLVGLRDSLISRAVQAVPGVYPTGFWEAGDRIRRSPANAHLLLPECEGDSLLFLLDAAGIACSTGSACHAGIPQPSHVVIAMGFSEAQARGALRLTLGHTSTQADVDAVVDALPEAVARAQRAYRARVTRTG